MNDNDEVRDEPELKFPGDAYQWYSNIRVNEILEKFVEDKYYTGEVHDKVTALVMKMSAEDAKNLLVALLNKNFEVGLKLLSES